MAKRKSYEIRKCLLLLLADGKEHTYGDIERKVNTNWQTVRMHCNDLMLFDAVIIKENKIKITPAGIKLSKKL